MARRISWTNNSSGHLGTYVYRAPTLDPQNLPAPVATVSPVAQGATAEWNDAETLAPGDYDYAVQDFDGQGVGALSALTAYNKPDPYAAAQIGDEIGGGVYAGAITYADSRQFHLIFAKQAGESAAAIQWGNYGTATGATDIDDGKANQELILTSFDDGTAGAFYHCRDYVDAEGNADYYLPSFNELAKVDVLVNMSHPEFSTDPGAYRWLSMEDSSNIAKILRFSTGAVVNVRKDETFPRTRPVRRVPV